MTIRTELDILEIVERLCPPRKITEYPRSVKNRYVMKCPARGHETDNPNPGSFKVHSNRRAGHCFSCDFGGSAWQIQKELGGDSTYTPIKKSAPTRPSKPRTKEPPTTIDELAAHRALDPVFLRDELNWVDGNYFGRPAIEMPYADDLTRYRVSLNGDKYRWDTGASPTLYGLWRLDWIKARGWVVLVEGETDVAQLLQHNIPALGVPGAKMWKPEWTLLLQGVQVFAVQETDKSGFDFVNDLAEIFPRLMVVELGGVKDPCALALLRGETFKDVFNDFLGQAYPANRAYDEVEIGTCFISENKTNRNKFGLRYAMERFTLQKAQFLAGEEAHLDSKNKRFVGTEIDKLDNCWDSYHGKKCLNTGETFYTRYRCGMPICPRCSIWLLEQFFEHKREHIEAAMDDPAIYIIDLFSHKFLNDHEAKASGIRKDYKDARKMLSRLTDSFKNDFDVAKTHCYGFRSIIEGDVHHLSVILLANHEGGAVEMLQRHFRKQTGVDSRVTEFPCQGSEDAIQAFRGALVLRVEFDTAENYRAWRQGTHGMKMVQGKGLLYRVSGAKKPKSAGVEEKPSACKVCGDCDPVKIFGFKRVATTKMQERRSLSGGVYYVLAEEDE